MKVNGEIERSKKCFLRSQKCLLLFVVTPCYCRIFISEEVVEHFWRVSTSRCQGRKVWITSLAGDENKRVVPRASYKAAITLRAFAGT